MKLRKKRIAGYLWFGVPLSIAVGCSASPDDMLGQSKQRLVQFPANIVENNMQAGEGRKRDDNGILFNPLWHTQAVDPEFRCALEPGVLPDPGFDACPSTWAPEATCPRPNIPDILGLCAFGEDGGDPVSGTGCTNEPLYINDENDTPDPTNLFTCHDNASIGFGGHLNWPDRITIEGPLNDDGSVTYHGADGDYNIGIRPANHGLLLPGNPSSEDDGQCDVGRRDILIEFKNSETVNRYNTPFWQAFVNDPIPMVQWSSAVPHKGYGIVTGVFSVDSVHDDPTHTEVHPAFAMSVLVSGGGGVPKAASSDPTIPECAGIGVGRFQNVTCGVDKWMSFVRSVGTEGDCGGEPENIVFADGRNEFKVRYPWFGPKGTSAKVTPVANARWGADSLFDLDLSPDLETDGGILNIDSSHPENGILVNYLFAAQPTPISVAGDLRFVTGSARLFNISRMITQDGSFVPDDGLPIPVSAQTFAKGDFNGDGRPDVAHLFKETDEQTSIEVYVSNGDGTLSTRQRWATNQFGWVPFATVLTGDFDGDGRDDLVSAYKEASSGNILLYFHRSTPTAMSGTNGFEAPLPWTLNGSGALVHDHTFLAGDFTGDRRADIAFAFKGGDDPPKVLVDVYESSPTAQNGAPGFVWEPGWLGVDHGGEWIDDTYQFLASDFTGDGRLDIAYAFRDDNTDYPTIDVEVYPFDPLAPSGTSRFQQSQRWASNQGGWVDGGFFIADDFTSDGRSDLAFIFPDDSSSSDLRSSIDVHESSASVNGGGPGFSSFGRWTSEHGGWLDGIWTSGDFDGDCAPDLVDVFNDGGSISQDLRRNLFVPNRTVDFSYVPPDMVVSTCDHPNIGQARAVNCNPHPGDPPPQPLTVTNNAPATFLPGLTLVTWTVTDMSTPAHDHKDVIQRVIVLAGDDPQCQLSHALAIGNQSQHSCTIMDNGDLKCWGENSTGQLGFATTQSFLGSVPSDGPFPVVPVTQPVVSAAVGARHTCVLLNDGSVKCWGYNGSGQLGQESTVNTNNAANATPVYLGGPAKAIAAGGDTSCAVLTSGALKCWGMGAQGQLGQNSTASLGRGANDMHNLQPIPIGGNVRSVTVGDLHVCALLDNSSRSVKCWGANVSPNAVGGGQLGQEDFTRRLSPALVKLPTTDIAQSVVAGGYHTCVLLTTGAVKCFGDNRYGQLGIDNTAHMGCCANTMFTHLPQAILGSPPIALAGGEFHTCALFPNGGTRCWGVDGFGQIGRPAIGNSATGDAAGEMEQLQQLGSVSLSSSATVKAITAGQNTSCALLSNGREKCWGYNSHGNLGIGDHVHRGWDLTKMGDTLPYVMIQ